MSAFWDSMNRANEAAITTHGEPITLDGNEITGVVDELSYEEAKSSGGRRSLVGCRVLVGAAVIPADGMPVVVRGLDGKVGSWETVAADGTCWLSIGSVNRWSGEVPGV